MVLKKLIYEYFAMLEDKCSVSCMAYRFLRRQAAELLERFVQGDGYKKYIKREGIDVDDIQIEDLYNMAGQDFNHFVDHILNPILRVYGIDAVVGKSNSDNDMYSDGIIIKWHNILVRDYYGDVLGSTLLECRIVTDDNTMYMHVCINISYEAVPIDFVLNPVSFFERKPLKSSYKFILKVIESNIAYYEEMFWTMKEVCGMGLVSDVSLRVIYMVLELLCNDNLFQG